VFLRCVYDVHFIFCAFGIFCCFFLCVFFFLKGHRKSLSEPGVSCSESMSLVLHYVVSLAFEHINDNDVDDDVDDNDSVSFEDFP